MHTAHDAATEQIRRDPVVFDLDARRFLSGALLGVQHWGRSRPTLVEDALDAYGRARAAGTRQRRRCALTFDGASGPRGGMLVLSCGMGKTVKSLAIIWSAAAARSCSCSCFLVEQWQEHAPVRAGRQTVGCIKQNRIDCDADIVIGMVQSIALRDYGADVFAKFGTLVVDEAHHMSAPVFSRALQRLPCRYVLALSATPERKDGMTNLLHYSMGPVLFKRERERGEGVYVGSSCGADPTSRRRSPRDGSPNLALMKNLAAADPAARRS